MGVSALPSVDVFVKLAARPFFTGVSSANIGPVTDQVLCAPDHNCEINLIGPPLCKHGLFLAFFSLGNTTNQQSILPVGNGGKWPSNTGKSHGTGVFLTFSVPSLADQNFNCSTQNLNCSSHKYGQEISQPRRRKYP